MMIRWILAAICISLPLASVFATELPAPIEVPDATAVATYHAEGAQIYECSLDAGHKMWRLREPVASLIDEGETVGRHYAGPTWEHKDGSMVRARVVGSAAGAMLDDLPWLRLDVETQLNGGALYGVSNVQRINTHGGAARGSCERVGAYLSVPYSADYVFLRKD
jgi:predicted Rdx family selenoprotein